MRRLTQLLLSCGISIYQQSLLWFSINRLPKRQSLINAKHVACPSPKTEWLEVLPYHNDQLHNKLGNTSATNYQPNININDLSNKRKLSREIPQPSNQMVCDKQYRTRLAKCAKLCEPTANKGNQVNMLERFKLVISLSVMVNISVMAASHPWEQINSPSHGSPNAIGTYNQGCLAGGQPLALTGEGYRVVHPERRRNYGHPSLLGFIQDYAKTLKAKGLQNILIADMSMPRGGPFSHGHRSHQIGLDVDIWFKTTTDKLTPSQQTNLRPINLVDSKNFRLESAWSSTHQQMLKIAAQDPRVARIFVNQVIKQQLCTHTQAKQHWLAKIRPWWGHTKHMHIRLHCPIDQPLCQEQTALAEGNGCQDLVWWKQQLTQPATLRNTPPAKPKPKVDLPAPCAQLLARPETKA